MSNGQRRGGTIAVKADGFVFLAKGEFSYNLGRPKRDPVIGSDGIHGFKETQQPAFIEGAITDDGTLDLAKLVTTTGATVTLELAIGKVISLRDSWYAGDGTGKTEEGEIPFRFEGARAEEIS